MQWQCGWTKEKRVLVATRSTGSSKKYITTNGNWLRRLKARQKLANPCGCGRHHSRHILTFWESKPLENSSWTESTLFIQWQEKCWTHDCASVDTTQVNSSADVDVIHHDAEKKHRFRNKEVQFFESCSKKKGSILWALFWKKKKKRGLNSLSRIQKGSILWVTFQKKFNSLNHVIKRFNSLCQKRSILWIILEKASIHWVIFKNRSNLWDN